MEERCNCIALNAACSILNNKSVNFYCILLWYSLKAHQDGKIKKKYIVILHLKDAYHQMLIESIMQHLFVFMQK